MHASCSSRRRVGSHGSVPTFLIINSVGGECLMYQIGSFKQIFVFAAGYFM